MILGLLVTLQMESITGVWKFILECGAGLGLVLILRWYWWRINAWTEITATVAPFAFYALSHGILGLTFPDSFFLTVGGTTVTWLIVAFVTKAENPERLKEFYDRVRPEGNWRIFRTGKRENRNNIVKLIVCWLSAVVMTYGILFLTGKIIFREWNEAMVYGLIVLGSGAILLAFLRKTKVFE